MGNLFIKECCWPTNQPQDRPEDPPPPVKVPPPAPKLPKGPRPPSKPAPPVDDPPPGGYLKKQGPKEKH